MTNVVQISWENLAAVLLNVLQQLQAKGTLETNTICVYYSLFIVIQVNLVPPSIDFTKKQKLYQINETGRPLL